MLDNRKTRYTHRILKETFIDLLTEKPVGSITVKEICEIADISKGSFYLHFENIDALQRELEEDIIGNIQKIFDSSEIVSKGLVTDAIIRDIYENQKMYYPLLCLVPNSPLGRKLVDLFLDLGIAARQHNKLYLDITREEMSYNAVVYIAFIRHWLITGCSVPVEKISATLRALNPVIHSKMK